MQIKRLVNNTNLTKKVRFSVDFLFFFPKKSSYPKKLSTIYIFLLYPFAYRRFALFSPFFYPPFSHRRLAGVERGKKHPRKQQK